MHLLAADDVPWLVPLFVDAMTANSRKRLVELGLKPAAVDRGLRAIERSLSDGPASRDELTRVLERAGITLDTGTRMHLYRLAVTSGIAVLGPDDGPNRSALVLVADWLGEQPRHDRDGALRELARRYLRAFGPATEADFAGWAGLPLRDVRAGLAAIGGELREVRLGNERGWTLRRPGRRARGRVVRLLPGWDTYLMGYRDRGFMAGESEWPRVTPGGEGSCVPRWPWTGGWLEVAGEAVGEAVDGEGRGMGAA